MVLNGARDNHTPRFDRVSLFIIPALIVLAVLVAIVLLNARFGFDAGGVCGSVALTSEALFDTSKASAGYFPDFRSARTSALSAMATAVVLVKEKLRFAPENSDSGEAR